MYVHIYIYMYVYGISAKYFHIYTYSYSTYMCMSKNLWICIAIFFICKYMNVRLHTTASVRVGVGLPQNRIK